MKKFLPLLIALPLLIPLSASADACTGFTCPSGTSCVVLDNSAFCQSSTAPSTPASTNITIYKASGNGTTPLNTNNCQGGTCTYTALEPLPGAPAQYSSAAEYLSFAFKWGVIVMAIFAVVMLAVSGVRIYLSSTSITSHDKAWARVRSVFWGLAIAVTPFIVLYTINPSILSFNQALGSPSGTTVGQPASGGQSSSNNTTPTNNTVNVPAGSLPTQQQQDACKGTIRVTGSDQNNNPIFMCVTSN
ncbi:MAG: hypothetical protein KGI70_01355 [Patescibacteria group bacterium]|nr:hypothetical protein [Patescibacteria group bacterium]